MRKYGIIGLGHVGATVALELVTKGLADQLVLIDQNEPKVTAEKIDLEDAQARLDSRTKIIIQDFNALKDVEVLYVTAGNIDVIDPDHGDRFGELKLNQKIVREIGPKIKASGFHGVLIDVMNPCDVMTSYLQAYTGLPKHRVFGTGTFLDTARMQKNVAAAVNGDPKNIDGYVYGEHGDSQFVAWSTVTINGQPVAEFQQHTPLDLPALEAAARRGGYDVFVGKHYTNVAIAVCAVKLGAAVIADAQLACPVSAWSEKYQTYVGQPAVVGANGIAYLSNLNLTDQENESLAKSAEFIKQKYDALPQP